MTALRAILRRMVSESALERPGRRVALSRMSEVLLRRGVAKLDQTSPARRGGWLGAMGGPYIGRAPELIHERPGWALDSFATSRIAWGSAARCFRLASPSSSASPCSAI